MDLFELGLSFAGALAVVSAELPLQVVVEECAFELV